MKLIDLIFATKERKRAERDYEKARERLERLHAHVDIKMAQILEDLTEQRIKDSRR